MECDRDRARRTELHDEVDRTDIDAEFERRGRDHGAQRAAFEAMFGIEADLTREAAVMRQNDALAEPGRERKRDPLAHAARADEDERRAMRADQFDEPVVGLRPQIAARDRAEFVVRHLDGERHLAPMADVKVCQSCHSFEKGGVAKVGPPLYGVLGRPKGSIAGFGYSDGMKGKGGDWTFADLNQFITKPSAYVSGTKMTYPGEPDPQKRADIIDYIDTLSDSPLPLPK